ncbi:MAG: AMP-binding protein [Variovorax sp.]
MTGFALQDLTLGNVLAHQAGRHPAKTFLTELATGRSWTYGEIQAWSGRVGNALLTVGAKKGSHVGVLLGNSAEHVATFFGIGRVGAVAVQVNTAVRGDLLHYYFDYADATVLVVDEEHAQRLAEVLPRLERVQKVLVLGTNGGPPSAEALSACGSRAVDFSRLIQDAAEALDLAPPACSDLLMFGFTSGTSGPSKACMLPHAAALTFGTGAVAAQGYTEDDVFYVCLPLFHNNALLSALASALVCGASVCLARRFSASGFWEDVRASGATVTNLLGAMSSFLWKQPPTERDADNKLRLVSASPTPSFAPEFEQRFNLRLMTNYGLSDFNVVTSFVPASAPPQKLGSIGLPRPDFLVRIVDDQDIECPAGVHGEIVIRSKEPWRAAQGYYKMPEATLVANRNQWFHTGDIGYRDADGYLWFVDRKKDCIRRRGENISAFEVEQVLLRHPAVAAVAVFPVSTSDNDEEVAAAVVPKEPGLDPAALVMHCSANMAYFMVPRYVQLVAALPTTTNQKVEKFKLRTAAEAALGTLWDRDKEGIELKR